MAKKYKNDEADLDEMMEGWCVVNKHQDPVAWSAWTRWRQDQMKSKIEPDNLTVPTNMPPSTIAAVREYFAIVRFARNCIGWRDTKSNLPKDPSAWMG